MENDKKEDKLENDKKDKLENDKKEDKLKDEKEENNNDDLYQYIENYNNDDYIDYLTSYKKLFEDNGKCIRSKKCTSNLQIEKDKIILKQMKKVI